MDGKARHQSVSGRAMTAVAGAAVVVALGVIAVVAGAFKGKEGKGAASSSGVSTTRPALAEAVRFTQRQRTTKALTGVQDVRLSLGDVTGGKVKMSVSLADGSELVEQRAVARGDEVTFKVQGRAYRLRVAELRNALIGDDEVVLVLAEVSSATTRPALTEQQKIERLIASVGDLKGAVFIRNGGEHSAVDAVDHMRRKWENGKGKIRTAKEFITHAGSRSSLSGEAYRIRMADGSEVTSEEFLLEKLGEIEGKGAATKPIQRNP